MSSLTCEKQAKRALAGTDLEGRLRQILTDEIARRGSVRACSKAFGVSHDGLTAWSRGDRIPTAESLAKLRVHLPGVRALIAQGLGLPVSAEVWPKLVKDWRAGAPLQLLADRYLNGRKTEKLCHAMRFLTTGEDRLAHDAAARTRAREIAQGAGRDMAAGMVTVRCLAPGCKNTIRLPGFQRVLCPSCKEKAAAIRGKAA